MRIIAVHKAIELAMERHGDQKYGNKSYLHHLYSVHNVLRRFKFDHPDLLEAAFLHDILEDTNTTYQEIEMMFGIDVAQLVHAVTNEPGPNRKARHEATYPKIKNTPNAIILKLADRIANVEECYENKDKRNKELLEMYRKEYANFKWELYSPGVTDQMWSHLHMLLT